MRWRSRFERVLSQFVTDSSILQLLILLLLLFFCYEKEGFSKHYYCISFIDFIFTQLIINVIVRRVCLHILYLFSQKTVISWCDEFLCVCVCVVFTLKNERNIYRNIVCLCSCSDNWYKYCLFVWLELRFNLTLKLWIKEKKMTFKVSNV